MTFESSRHVGKVPDMYRKFQTCTESSRHVGKVSVVCGSCRHVGEVPAMYRQFQTLREVPDI